MKSPIIFLLPSFDTLCIHSQLAWYGNKRVFAVLGVGETGVTPGGSVPGGCVLGGSVPAFTMCMAEHAPLPVLLAVPHAGRAYPPALMEQMYQPHKASLRLEDRLVDHVAEAVARCTGAALLVAHAPRAMIDLNRMPDDIDWEMIVDGAPHRPMHIVAGGRARSGLGLIPRRLPGMGELWRQPILHSELEERIAHIHAPYHAALGAGLERLLHQWDRVLLLDLHSMPPLGPKKGAHAAADFVVGDRFGTSCDPLLAASALNHFSVDGYRVAHNRPYAGGYVLDRHGAPGCNVHALQIEICRTMYLDKGLEELGQGYSAVVGLLVRLVQRLAAELATGHAYHQAAE